MPDDSSTQSTPFIDQGAQPPPYAAADILSQQMQPPMAVSPSAQQGMIPSVQDPMLTPTPTSPDVTAHESMLHHILNTVGGILGGSETMHVTKDEQGNVTVSRDPSTMGEKWGRVAAAALGGAATGLANSVGPNAAARAGAAGFQQGAQIPQQREQQVQQEATVEQQMLMKHAQNALLQQKIADNALNMTAKNIKLGADSVDRFNKIDSDIQSFAANQKVQDFGTMKDLTDYESGHPDAIKGHMNSQYYAAQMPNGKFRLYAVDPAWLDQKNDKPFTLQHPEMDADGNVKMVDGDTVPANNMTNRDRYQRYEQSQDAKLGTMMTQGAQIKEKAQQAKEAAAAREQMTPYQRAELGIRQQELNLKNPLAAGGGTGAGAGLHGDPYLNTIPAEMREQVKSIARGDAKMPSGARAGQAQALRNAVFNYDPTYTDARYDTKQNFKTKGDATGVQQLSAALEHVENAQNHSRQVGFAPLLSHNATGADAAYNQDLKLFTQEAGKMVKGGVLGQGEYEDLKKGMDSSRQSVRDSAIKETINLLGGRVAATFQKYKTGAGNDLPVEEFFDAPTQARLRRYGMTQQPGAAAAPARPAGVPPSYVYQNGAHGPGWYNPTPQTAQANP